MSKANINFILFVVSLTILGVLIEDTISYGFRSANSLLIGVFTHNSYLMSKKWIDSKNKKELSPDGSDEERRIPYSISIPTQFLTCQIPLYKTPWGAYSTKKYPRLKCVFP